MKKNNNASCYKGMFSSLVELDEIYGRFYHSRKICTIVLYKIIMRNKFICH